MAAILKWDLYRLILTIGVCVLVSRTYGLENTHIPSSPSSLLILSSTTARSSISQGNFTDGIISPSNINDAVNVNVRLNREEILGDNFTISSKLSHDNDTKGSQHANNEIYVNMYRLPSHWEEFCAVQYNDSYESIWTPLTNLTTIKCHVTTEHSNIWKLDDLRESISLYPEQKFAVELTCVDWSNVTVPRPVRAKSLIKFVMTNCTVLDYFEEFDKNLIDTIPDSVRVLEVYNIIIPTSAIKSLERMKNIELISPSYLCSHEKTIESIVMQNESYKLYDMPSLEMIDEIGAEFFRDAKLVTYRCNYRHLMNFQQTRSKSMSYYHNELHVEDAMYPVLQVYNQSHNNMPVLKDSHLQWSIHFPKLETLDLSHNRVSQIYRFASPITYNQGHVTTINLQYNNISAITVKDVKHFLKLPTMFIDLRNNRLNCNCSDDLIDLYDYLNQTDVGNYTYIKDLQCFTPRLVNRTLGSLTKEDICAADVSEVRYTIPVIFLSISLLILCIIIFVLLRYRTEVTILLYTKLNIIVPCQSRDVDRDRQYTAFVSYSSRDEDWVEEFFGKLEEQPEKSGTQSFRFCLHHRDFVPGMTIFDNVIKSVESSRHTIILLSNNFVSSQYCLYEFQEAFRQSILEKKRHLVIVMMEKIDQSQLPRDLKRCLSTFTYIRKEDYLFKERLIYAISIRNRKHLTENKNASDQNSDKHSKIGRLSKVLDNNSLVKQLRQLTLSRKLQTNVNKDLEATIDMNLQHKADIQNPQKDSKTPHENNRANQAVAANNSSFDNRAYNCSEHESVQTVAEFPQGQTDIAEKCLNGHCVSDTLVSDNVNKARDVDLQNKRKLCKNGLHIATICDSSCMCIPTSSVDYDRSISVMSSDTGYGSDRCISVESPSSDLKRFKPDLSPFICKELSENETNMSVEILV